MNQKEKRISIRQTVEKAAARDEHKCRIQFAASSAQEEVLENLHSALHGLDAETVAANRAQYGSNKVTHEKKKSFPKRLAGAFVNPFTAILFSLHWYLQ